MEELVPGLSGTGLPVPKGLTVKRTFDASTTPLEIDEDIPEEVTDVKDIHGNAVAKVTSPTPEKPHSPVSPLTFLTI